MLRLTHPLVFDGMESWLVPVIGVVGALAGTIVGAVLTQRLQRGTAAYTQLHEERLIGYSAFPAALMEYRRVLTERAFQSSQGRAAQLGGISFRPEARLGQRCTGCCS